MVVQERNRYEYHTLQGFIVNGYIIDIMGAYNTFFATCSVGPKYSVYLCWGEAEGQSLYREWKTISNTLFSRRDAGLNLMWEDPE